MKQLLRKELVLSASPLAFIFIAFSFMTLIPGYPILCGAFFITLGIFHSFQNAREANDTLYTALLPIAKSDVVKGKYLFVMFIELTGISIMMVLTFLRMSVLAGSEIYLNNAMMNANMFFIAMALLIFAAFNYIFIGGFFKTAYDFSKPFITYAIVSFAVIMLAEAAHHIPGLEALNAFGFEYFGLQIILLIGGILLYGLLTYLSYKKACHDFDRIDL
ncbi:MAG: ABC-2 transporter permease [Erysipelotrichaceae bacterium]|nr:ABC-2 transporter permease [Erysipelotrichaceae bacterium]